MASGGRMSLSNRQINLRFEQWGYQQVGIKNGIVTWRNPETGRTTQVFASTHHQITKARKLYDAAADMDLSIDQFILGPDESGLPVLQTRHIVTWDNQQLERFSDPVVPEEEMEPSPEVSKDERPAWVKLIEFLEVHHNRSFRMDSLARLLNITLSAASQGMQRAKKEDSRIVLVGASKSARWMLEDEGLKHAAEKAARDRFTQWARAEQKAREEEVLRELEVEEQKLLFTKIGVDGFGRVILADHENVIYVALKVEPGFMPVSVENLHNNNQGG